MSLTPAARNAGSNDLFFTFSGAGGFLFNINWFNFNGDSPAASPGPVNPAPVPAPIAGPVNPVPAPIRVMMRRALPGASLLKLKQSTVQADLCNLNEKFCSCFHRGCK